MSEKSPITPARDRMPRGNMVQGSEKDKDIFLDIITTENLDEETRKAGELLASKLGEISGLSIRSVNDLFRVLRSKGIQDQIKNDPELKAALEKLAQIREISDELPELMSECFRHAAVDVFNTTERERKKTRKSTILAMSLSTIVALGSAASVFLSIRNSANSDIRHSKELSLLISQRDKAEAENVALKTKQRELERKLARVKVCKNVASKLKKENNFSEEQAAKALSRCISIIDVTEEK